MVMVYNGNGCKGINSVISGKVPEWKLEKASDEVTFETRPEKKESTVLKVRRKALKGKGTCFASLNCR